MESGRVLMGCVTDGSANIASASVLSSLSLRTVRRLVGLVSACVSMFLGDHWKEVGDQSNQACGRMNLRTHESG